MRLLLRLCLKLKLRLQPQRRLRLTTFFKVLKIMKGQAHMIPRTLCVEELGVCTAEYDGFLKASDRVRSRIRVRVRIDQAQG